MLIPYVEHNNKLDIRYELCYIYQSRIYLTRSQFDSSTTGYQYSYLSDKDINCILTVIILI